MFALADCNNFFVSCERVFNPSLAGRPVIVLSNNDGCAIARSNEAKALGIKMGDPLFRIKHIIDAHNVAVLSGNMELYGDMSRRVHDTLRSFIPSMEVYSIDEAFLDLRGLDPSGLADLGARIAYTCMRNTGIPVSVGISHTKTLAKIASRLCKKYPKLKNSCYMYRQEDIDKVLGRFPVADVWGIGRRSVGKLSMFGIDTAYKFAHADPGFVRGLTGLPGYRTMCELNCIPCIGFEDLERDRQSICTSRSFSSEIGDITVLSEQVSTFAAMTARKLRKQHSLCGSITVFASTNRFREDEPQEHASEYVEFGIPTNSSIEICRAAVSAVSRFFRRGTMYKRAGVVADRIISEKDHQLFLFGEEDRTRHDELMKAMDRINGIMGKNTVRVASEGDGSIAHNREHMSARYTTSWDDIPKVHNIR